MKRLHFLVCLALAVLAAAVPAVAGPQDAGLYPDLRTVVPTRLGIQNQQQREILRFSNGVANTGPGPWRMRPEPPPGSDTQVTNGVQEILDADGAAARLCLRRGTARMREKATARIAGLALAERCLAER